MTAAEFETEGRQPGVGTKAWLGAALPVWVATRVGMAGMGVFAAAFAGYMLQHASSPLRVWFQWDTGWYLTISQLGYFSRASANFFPLYPSLVAGAMTLLGHPHAPPDDTLRLAVALSIANICALAVFGAVALLAAEVASGLGERAALALAAYPFAFFLAAAYTEAPFVALATISLVLARRRRWLPAAACALLAGLTRSAAVVLVLPLAWEALRLRRGRENLALGLGMALAPLAGIGLYMAYLAARFGDPLLFAHTQAGVWHHQLLAPWQTAALVAEHLRHPRSGLLPLDVAVWAGALVALVAGARRLPLSFTLFAAGGLAIAVAAPVPSANDVLASAGRYLLAATPVFVVVARWMRANRYFELVYLVCGLLLQAGLLLTFLLGGPVM